MERRNDDQDASLPTKGGSTSSIATDLFGPKHSTCTNSSSNTAGIFTSVFQPHSSSSSSYSQAAGRDLLQTEAWGSWGKQGPGFPVGDPQQATQEGVGSSGNASQSSLPIKAKNTGYLDEDAHPCFLSSSLYYGGRDICSHTPNPRHLPTASHTNFHNQFQDGGEDDPNLGNPNTASRGNWWQGSLYY